MNLITRPYDDSSLDDADRAAIALFNQPYRWFTSVLLQGLLGAAFIGAPAWVLASLAIRPAPETAMLLRLYGALLLYRAFMEQFVRSRLALSWIYAFLIASLPFEVLSLAIVGHASYKGVVSPWGGGAISALLLVSVAQHGSVLSKRYAVMRRSRFQNVAGVTWTQPLLPLLWWRLERIWKRRRGSQTLPKVVTASPARLADLEPHLTWIGHATFVMRLGGKLVATDPIWRGQLYYMERLTPPGVPIEELPGLDVVTVTHNHFDHLDLGTLVELERLYQPVFLVPRNNGWILRRSGIDNVVELDWWESYRLGGLEVTLVPAQHWSQRGPLDTNTALWGGFVYRGPEGTAYHAGDTAFEAEVFRQIAQRFTIDWAMLPISAYDPEWFLQTQHVNPEDAGRAFELLKAKTFVAMHYGTYELTDEPVGEPVERARAWFEERGERDRLWALDVGETRSLFSRDSP
jgi:L-ascorbate metabolism protein UlaG (beta-lactamase superfamily)